MAEKETRISYRPDNENKAFLRSIGLMPDCRTTTKDRRKQPNTGFNLNRLMNKAIKEYIQQKGILQLSGLSKEDLELKLLLLMKNDSMDRKEEVEKEIDRINILMKEVIERKRTKELQEAILKHNPE